MTRLNGLATVALLAVVFGGHAPAATAQDLYGSVAFSREPEGGYAWGMSWNDGNHAAATSRTVTACQGRGGSDCAERLWFRNGCGALFIGGTNGWGIGTGGSKHRAEAKAREACESVNATCRLAVSRCTAKPGTPAVIKSEAGSRQALYGSIAFSQEATGGYAWGISWDHGSREAASGSASTACQGEGGTNCAERLWFRNGCGVLFIAPPNGWGTARSESKTQAESAARRACQSSNTNCRLAVSQCTSGPGTSPAIMAQAGSYQHPTTTPAQRAQERQRQRQREAAANRRQTEARGQASTGSRDDKEQKEKGTLTFTDGGRYEGEIRDGKQHGRGTTTLPDGDRYAGEYRNGKRQGRGTLIPGPTAGGMRAAGATTSGTVRGL